MGFMGELGDARKVFDEMCVRDLISWTTLIVAYVRVGDMGEAGVLFDGLGVKDMVAWTAMVMGFAQKGKPREALEWFDKMVEAGVEMDEVTLACVISACGQLGATNLAVMLVILSQFACNVVKKYCIAEMSMIIMVICLASLTDVYFFIKIKNIRSIGGKECSMCLCVVGSLM
ncbi:peptidase S28, Tetratricopeptide-like helical domain, DYW domain protein [Artemisia annua]|uniref:Peptidase S28, Tetratricopeptide-like helical domain, DYW domain protein n=1 Tax=Artemisia annua TaxID=35608 RepID=A0A2U1NDZ3_ARTAN|nr:peptidase S28, Tetratricopeptide-like helical domain, DYW domain protein [Artemisia annua]